MSTKMVRFILPVVGWDTGALDGNGNEIWEFLDFIGLVNSCSTHMSNNNMYQVWGTQFSGTGESQPQVFEAITDDLATLKTDIAAYITSQSPPASPDPSPVYLYDFDVTVSP